MEDILQRYLDMENSGIGIYFDADEIIELLEYFEDIEDFDHYKKVVKIGHKLHPHNTDIQLRICKAHFYDNNYEKSLTLIEQLGDTENHDSHLLKCECLCALDRYNDLIAYLEWLQNNSDETLQDTYEYLAHILHEQYESMNAFDLVKRGLILFPESRMLKEELVYQLEIHGEIEQAVEICKELIDCDPYNVEYWYMLGRLYTITESYDKAIEAFDFALVCDDTDMEIKILKAFCYFWKQNFELVTDIYMDFFFKETNLISEHVKPFIDISDDFECAYLLLKKMIEMFDNLGKGSLRLLLENNEDEVAVNGLLSIADCFPSSLLFLLYQEIILIAEGEHQSILNCEQLLQFIYETGENNSRFRVNSENKLCFSLKQKIEKIVDEQIPCVACNDNNLFTVNQILKHLMDGNISMFCQLYTQISPTMISEYFEKLFPACKKSPKQQTVFLDLTSIHKNEANDLDSSKLAVNYIANKNHNN